MVELYKKIQDLLNDYSSWEIEKELVFTAAQNTSLNDLHTTQSMIQQLDDGFVLSTKPFLQRLLLNQLTNYVANTYGDGYTFTITENYYHKIGLVCVCEVFTIDNPLRLVDSFEYYNNKKHKHLYKKTGLKTYHSTPHHQINSKKKKKMKARGGIKK